MLLEVFRNAPTLTFVSATTRGNLLGLENIPFRPDTTVHTRGIGPGRTFERRAYTLFATSKTDGERPPDITGPWIMVQLQNRVLRR